MPTHIVIFHVQSEVLSTVLEAVKHPGVKLEDVRMLREEDHPRSRRAKQPRMVHRMEQTGVHVLLAEMRRIHPRTIRIQDAGVLFERNGGAAKSAASRMSDLHSLKMVHQVGGDWGLTSLGITGDLDKLMEAARARARA